ncbi:hydrogenase [bacterium]|nr:hydrogenase [bacterium]
MSPAPLETRNAQAVPIADVPDLGDEEFRDAILTAVSLGSRVSALFGHPAGEGKLRLFCVLANDELGSLALLSRQVERRFMSLANDCPGVHLFEREIFEQWGVEPHGHPWLKPVRFQPPLVAAGARASQIGVANFFRVEGEEVHEVAVGPVHAGVIEPGHFRFQCHGEDVFHLEISLGYQHRGVERALAGGPDKRTIHYIETLAGDTTIGHAVAHCETLEALAGAEAPARAHAIRGIALELERLANHTGDLGALANDVGYLPTASYCGRLRGDFLNMTAAICGSRFGRGLVRPGGVAFDVEPARSAELQGRLARAMRDIRGATGLLWETPSVMARFEETGTVTRETCEKLGFVGVAARACGVGRDARQDFPLGMFRFSQVPVMTWHTGDVFARAFVRALEVESSGKFIDGQLKALPAGPVLAALPERAPDRIVATLVEGWRGEVCHVALTDERGRFSRYKVVDPSFHNWTGLALALRGQQISDFPLCNKSFNLSYCGHDL